MPKEKEQRKTCNPPSIKNIEELPAVLTVDHVKDFLGIGRDKTYQLYQDPRFPWARALGKPFRIDRERFLQWWRETYQLQTA